LSTSRGEKRKGGGEGRGIASQLAGLLFHSLGREGGKRRGEKGRTRTSAQISGVLTHRPYSKRKKKEGEEERGETSHMKYESGLRTRSFLTGVRGKRGRGGKKEVPQRCESNLRIGPYHLV